MRFRNMRSSQGYAWKGFESFIYEASDGYSNEFFAYHSISMHIGAPLLVTIKGDSAKLQRCLMRHSHVADR